MVIYKTTFPNGKIYIGQDRYNNAKYFGSGVKCSDAIKKFGKENCKKEILRECETQKQLDFFEAYYIKKFNSTNKEIGYNILPGTANKFGSGSPMLIEEVRNKLKNTIKNRTKERRIEISKINSEAAKKFYKENPDKKPIGKKNGMFGKKHSEEHRLNISIKTKQFFDDNPQVKEILSEKSFKMWKDFKENGRAEEIIKKRSESKKKKILQLNLKNNKIIKEWSSAVDIENELGFCRMNIGKCCRDNRKNLIYHRYGYKWIYNE